MKEPETYWEKRCAILEELVFDLLQVVAQISFPSAQDDLRAAAKKRDDAIKILDASANWDE